MQIMTRFIDQCFLYVNDLKNWWICWSGWASQNTHWSFRSCQSCRWDWAGRWSRWCCCTARTPASSATCPNSNHSKQPDTASFQATWFMCVHGRRQTVKMQWWCEQISLLHYLDLDTGLPVQTVTGIQVYLYRQWLYTGLPVWAMIVHRSTCTGNDLYTGLTVQAMTCIHVYLNRQWLVPRSTFTGIELYIRIHIQ